METALERRPFCVIVLLSKLLKNRILALFLPTLAPIARFWFATGTCIQKYLQYSSWSKTPCVSFLSRAVATYLCNQYGATSQLYPKDPKARAKVDQVLYISEDVSSNVVAYTVGAFDFDPCECWVKTWFKWLLVDFWIFELRFQHQWFTAVSKLSL